MTITTIAGTDTKSGFVDGKGTASQFSRLSIDQQAGHEGGSVIRKIDLAGNVK